MKFNRKNLVSINDANQNFLKVTQLVDENGIAIILKNNVPRYVLVDYSYFENEETIAAEDINIIAKRLVSKYKEAFEELKKK